MSTLKLSVADPEFVDKIIFEVKSQGHFDMFRKECLADVGELRRIIIKEKLKISREGQMSHLQPVTFAVDLSYCVCLFFTHSPHPQTHSPRTKISTRALKIRCRSFSIGKFGRLTRTRIDCVKKCDIISYGKLGLVL